MTQYQVELDVFHGPLDLLLYLVKRSELDLRTIPLARLTDQYLAYLQVIQMIDVEGAGEFVVMAGTLMEIKSKVVLPRTKEEEAEEAEDPRQELVQQLIEYKRFKEAAGYLEEKAERQSHRHSRRPPPPPTSKAPTPIQPVELWDLVSAFGRLLQETLTDQQEEIVADQTPIHVYADQILNRLRTESEVRFSSLFAPPHTRSRLVGIFLAVLELTRGFLIFAEQEGTFGDMVLTLAPERVEEGTSD